MPPVMYGDSTHWRSIKANAADIPSNETLVPWLFSEYGNADVISGTYRADGLDIVVTDVNGDAVPRYFAAFSKGDVRLHGGYRDPAQDTVSGGTELYLQWGGETVNVVNDPNVFHDGWGGSKDHTIAYPLEEASSDAINAANPGTYDGTVDATYEATGEVGKAYSFDGSDEIRAQNSGSLGFGGTLTVMGYVKGIAQTNKAVIAQWDAIGSQRSYLMNSSAWDNDKLFIALSKDGGNSQVKYYESSIITFDDTPHHIAFSWDSGTLKLFIDGVEDTNVDKKTDTAMTTIYNSTVDMMVGSYLDNNNPAGHITAMVDEARVLKAVLSPNQIKGQYNNWAGFATNASITLGDINLFVEDVIVITTPKIRTVVIPFNDKEIIIPNNDNDIAILDNDNDIIIY